MLEFTNIELFILYQTSQVLIGLNVFGYFSGKGPQQNSLNHGRDLNVFKTRCVGITRSVLVLVGSQTKIISHGLFS